MKTLQGNSIDGRIVAPSLLDSVPRIGVLSWSFVGLVVASCIVVFALGAVSALVLPITFAVVLAILFKPLVGILTGHRLKPALAAGIVVVGFLILMLGVAIITVRGVVDQGGKVSANADIAITHVSDLTGAISIDEATLQGVKDAVQEAAPMIISGVLAGIISVFGTIIAVAGGSLLGLLVMYYLLKDGTSMRKSLILQVRPAARHEFDEFIGAACRILRDYGRGRTVLSAIVAAVIGVAALLLGLPLVLAIVVVNFVGGYIPYIGAFLGGGLAVIVALGDGGISKAVIMLVVVLASNILLENFVAPKVMGNTLDIHPLSVLVVTALGGLLGGLVGLILAVPFYMIAGDALRRLRFGSLAEHSSGRV
jgi:predicted PurR-regulated permease PerM